MLELLLAPPLGLGGHAGSLREGFHSIRAMGFGAPLVIASLPPPTLPDAQPSAAHDAKPTLRSATAVRSSSSVARDIGDGSSSISLPASSSASRRGHTDFDSEFDVDGPEADFSGLAVGRGRSFSGSFNLGADASIMTAGWRARLLGNSQKYPDAWGSGLARAVASVPPPGSWVRAITGVGHTEEGSAGSGDAAPGGAYEALAVPPLPGAVAAAGANFDMFCHQYDVVPRLFGPGNGVATADALRLLLPGVGINGGGSAQEHSVVATPDSKSDRLRREATACSMTAYGLLGSAHMLFSLPEEDWYDEWKDSSDDDDEREDHGKPSLPHVLSAGTEQQGQAQRCCCVTVPFADEERWLRLPPLPYLRHGAEVREQNCFDRRSRFRLQAQFELSKLLHSSFAAVNCF